MAVASTTWRDRSPPPNPGDRCCVALPAHWPRGLWGPGWRPHSGLARPARPLTARATAAARPAPMPARTGATTSSAIPTTAASAVTTVRAACAARANAAADPVRKSATGHASPNWTTSPTRTTAEAAGTSVLTEHARAEPAAPPTATGRRAATMTAAAAPALGRALGRAKPVMCSHASVWKTAEPYAATAEHAAAMANVPRACPRTSSACPRATPAITTAGCVAAATRVKTPLASSSAPPPPLRSAIVVTTNKGRAGDHSPARPCFRAVRPWRYGATRPVHWPAASPPTVLGVPDGAEVLSTQSRWTCGFWMHRSGGRWAGEPTFARIAHFDAIGGNEGCAPVNDDLIGTNKVAAIPGVTAITLDRTPSSQDRQDAAPYILPAGRGSSVGESPRAGC